MHMVGLVRVFFSAETKITNKAINSDCLMFSKYLQVPKMINNESKPLAVTQGHLGKWN